MTNTESKPKHPGGRPTDYTPEIAERICEWIAGGKSLRSFCVQPDVPDVSTVCRWIIRHEEFRAHYVHAREAAGYAHGDGIIEITEQLRTGQLDYQVAKPMIDGLKWAAERMAPKGHGTKMDLNLGGQKDGAPVSVLVKYE